MKLRDVYPLYLNNKAVQPNTDLKVIDKFTGEIAFRTALATPDVIDEAIAGAVRAAEPMARLASYEKQDVLNHCVARFKERFDELAYALCVEAGKPIADSEGEVGRLIDTFRIAAEEATRNYGEIQPLDISARAKGYMGMWKRVPIGPCSFISPFNFPLNLAAHKIAPAIAMGCPFVMKPASMTPLGAIIMGEVLAECDILPEGAFSILPASRDGADLFTTDERLKLLSFTGSPGVGWDLKAKAGKKKVVLELGGNAAVIVDKDADLDHALARIIFGGYYQSGQSCIHVQRVIIHADIYDRFRDMLVAKVKTLKSGDPKNRDTFIGPMISAKEAQRLKGWIDDAVAAGRRCSPVAAARAICSRRRCSKMYPRGRTWCARKPSARWSSCRASPTGTPHWPRSTTANSACRPGSSPATFTRYWKRGTTSTSAASSSMTSPPIASTICPMAGSRIRASGAKASVSRWKI